MNANLKTAIQGCKNVTPNQVWIGFEYVNDDGIRIKQRQVRLCRLYKDWYGEYRKKTANGHLIQMRYGSLLVLLSRENMMDMAGLPA